MRRTRRLWATFLTSKSSSVWSISVLCVPSWLDGWAGPPPAVGTLLIPSPSSCSSAGTGYSRTNGWNRAETLRNLRHPRYADLALRFGFEDAYPTEGGVRYWLTTIGENAISDETICLSDEEDEEPIEVAVQLLNQLIAQSVKLFVEHGFLSQEAWEDAFVCPDGMLHHAASRMRCSSVRATCYQPTSPDDPRPCPAQEKGCQGGDCDTIARTAACQYATPWDAEARFVWYTGSNQPQNSPNRSTDKDQKDSKRGKPCYGYRSLPLQIPDPNRRFSIVLLDDFMPANAREENPAAALLSQLPLFYPSLAVAAVAGDAGFGYEVFLDTVYNGLHARRVVDLRSHTTDDDKSRWLVRGYDDEGRPVCPYGYTFTANGFDVERQRHKWFCGQACLDGKDPLVFEDAPYPPPECPHADLDSRPYGKIIDVGERFENGSMRLVRREASLWARQRGSASITVLAMPWKGVTLPSRNGTSSACPSTALRVAGPPSSWPMFGST